MVTYIMEEHGMKGGDFMYDWMRDAGSCAAAGTVRSACMRLAPTCAWNDHFSECELSGSAGYEER
jgi:hypothetical protein